LPYRKHLSKDKVLKNLIQKQGPLTINKRRNIYLHLCASIISQQLSAKVADVIYNRFLYLFTTKTPKPAEILAIPDEQYRSIGMSNAKTQYVKNVCRFFIEYKITDTRLHKMNNEEVLELLTQIKGVGQWTTEMILMFTLAREDVFSHGDFGLQKAILQLYNVEHSNKKELSEKIELITHNWSPYKTYACLHLWKHIDAK
jgi:DNA-3-methyladenine glycosylase II